jgi:O-antigen/teichoic acid export membrane protein
MFKHNIYNLIISYIGLFLGFFNTIIKPKVILSEEIGVLATIISIATILQLLTQFGMSGVLMKYYPEFANSKRSKSKFILSILSITTVLLLIVVTILYFSKSYILGYFNEPLLDHYFVFIIIFLILTHLSSIFGRMAQIIFISVQSNFITNILKKVIHTLFLIYMLIYGIGFDTYFKFFTILSIVSVVAVSYIVFKNMEIELKFKYFIPEFELIKKVSNYSFFMLISSLSGIMVVNIDKIMIGHYLDFSQTGIYAIALAISSALAIILGAFLRIVQPQLANAISNNDYNKMNKVYNENIANNLYFGTIIFVLISVFSFDILSFLGKEYSTGNYVIILIASGHYANLFVGSCGEVIALSKFYRFNFYSRIFLLIIVVLSNYLFIPIWGITGAALATCLNYLLYDLFKTIYAYKKFGIHPLTFMNLKFLISGLIVFTLTFLTKNYLSRSIISITVIFFISVIVYDLMLSYIFNYKYSFINKVKAKYLRKRT